MEETEGERVQISFTTTDPELSVSSYPIYVQLDSGRGDLSDMVKSLLAASNLDAARIPSEFEFLVQEELLVSSLRQLVQDRSLPMDALLRVEFFPRRAPPSPHAELRLGDFVSCVRSAGRHLLIGCYDRSVAVGDVDGGCVLELPVAHDKEVKAVDWLQIADAGAGAAEGEATFVTAGHDQDCKLWRWVPGMASGRHQCLALCKGHAGSVLCVAGSPRPAVGHFASGSFDGQVKLWRSGGSGTNGAAGDDLIEETGGIAHQSKHQLPTRVPLRTLPGHKDAVHSLTYAGAGHLVSGGADCCARLWDVEVGAETALLRAPCAFLSLHSRAADGAGRALLLAGCAGPQPRLYDPRSAGDTLVACFSAHDSWVSGVRWCPQPGSNLFATSGYEAVVKLWDLRCVRAPLYDLRDHDGIVTSVDWTETGHVVSASADATVKIFNANLI